MFKPGLTVFSFLLSTVLFLTGPGPVQTQEVDVNAVNLNGTTPLFRAVWKYQDESAADLLNRGADPNIRTGASARFPDRTPLYEAVLQTDRSMVKLLLEHGADPDARTTNAEKFPGRTPLFEAVLIGNRRIARLLLEHGADPNIPTGGKDRVTPLATAVINGDHAIARLLLEHGADPNIPTGGKDRVTPLATAVINGDHAIARLLLEHGADPLLVLKSGKSEGTILAHAAGYRIPGYRYSRKQWKTLGTGWLHQLMLSHVDDPAKLDDTMRWQGKGCYGYVVQREDRRLGIIAQKVYGDADRWPEIARLNDISRDKPYRMGDCLKVFEVEW